MNANIQTLTTIWCILIFLGISVNPYAQTSKALFKAVPSAKTVLSASEFSKYAELDTDKIKEKALIEITDLEQVLQNSMLSVPLKGINHALRNERFSRTKVENLYV